MSMLWYKNLVGRCAHQPCVKLWSKNLTPLPPFFVEDHYYWTHRSTLQGTKALCKPFLFVFVWILSFIFGKMSKDLELLIHPTILYDLEVWWFVFSCVLSFSREILKLQALVEDNCEGSEKVCESRVKKYLGFLLLLPPRRLDILESIFRNREKSRTHGKWAMDVGNSMTNIHQNGVFIFWRQWLMR